MFPVRNNSVNTARNIHLIPLLCAAIFAAGGCATFFGPPPKPLTQQEIIELARSGMPDSEILQRIRDSRTAYRLTAQEIVSLREAGVSFTVLDYMMQTYVDRVREDQRYLDQRYWWNYHDHWYWCPPYHHHHVR